MGNTWLFNLDDLIKLGHDNDLISESCYSALAFSLLDKMSPRLRYLLFFLR